MPISWWTRTGKSRYAMRCKSSTTRANTMRRERRCFCCKWGFADEDLQMHHFHANQPILINCTSLKSLVWSIRMRLDGHCPWAFPSRQFPVEPLEIGSSKSAIRPDRNPFEPEEQSECGTRYTSRRIYIVTFVILIV